MAPAAARNPPLSAAPPPRTPPARPGSPLGSTEMRASPPLALPRLPPAAVQELSKRRPLSLFVCPVFPLTRGFPSFRSRMPGCYWEIEKALLQKDEKRVSKKCLLSPALFSGTPSFRAFLLAPSFFASSAPRAMRAFSSDLAAFLLPRSRFHSPVIMR